MDTVVRRDEEEEEEEEGVPIYKNLGIGKFVKTWHSLWLTCEQASNVALYFFFGASLFLTFSCVTPVVVVC